MRALSVITKLTVLRPDDPKTRLLYLLKVARANNMDTIGVADVEVGVAEGVTSKIAKYLTEVDILLYK